MEEKSKKQSHPVRNFFLISIIISFVISIPVILLYNDKLNNNSLPPTTTEQTEPSKPTQSTTITIGPQVINPTKPASQNGDIVIDNIGFTPHTIDATGHLLGYMTIKLSVTIYNNTNNDKAININNFNIYFENSVEGNGTRPLSSIDNKNEILLYKNAGKTVTISFDVDTTYFSNVKKFQLKYNNKTAAAYIKN